MLELESISHFNIPRSGNYLVDMYDDMLDEEEREDDS